MIQLLNKNILKIFIVFVFLILAGCTVKVPTTKITAVQALVQKNFPSNQIHAHGNLEEGVNSSLDFLRKTSQENFIFGSTIVKKAVLLSSLENFLVFLRTKPSEDGITSYLKNNFTWHQSAANKVLITGYYIPYLEGSYDKDYPYRHPLYSVPPDLVSINLDKNIKDKLSTETPVINRGRIDKKNIFIPYYSREEIDVHNKLAGLNLELLYLKDPIERFFLHIQGSGIIKLPSGQTITAAFADKNGHPYRAIGKKIIDMGLLTRDNVSMDSIKDVLRKNPALTDSILNWNPSYVFFKLNHDKAKGSLNTPVESNVSVATDQSLFPKAAMGLLKHNNQWRIIFNHDTGGAITGAGRVDLFTGYGEDAGKMASNMQDDGMIGFLAPK